MGAPVCVQAEGNGTQNGLVQLVNVQTHRLVLFAALSDETLRR